MASRRSTKYDSKETPLENSFTETPRKIAEFTASFEPVARAIGPSSVGVIGAAIEGKAVESGLNQGPVGGALASLYTDLTSSTPIHSTSTIKGFTLDVPWAKEIQEFLENSVKPPLDTFSSILSQIKALLELLKNLIVNLDDVLYILVVALIKKIDEMLSLLDIDEGAYLLLVPPKLPRTVVGDTSLDTYITTQYALLVSNLRERLAQQADTNNEAFVLRDLDYVVKPPIGGAFSVSDLKSVMLASLDDKYDPYRPQASVGGDDNSYSMGIIVSAGGPYTSVKNIFKGWHKLLKWSDKFDVKEEGILRPVIDSFEYVGLSKTGQKARFNASVSIGASGFSLYTSSVFLPVKCSLALVRRISTVTSELLSDVLPFSVELDEIIQEPLSHTDYSSPRASKYRDSSGKVYEVKHHPTIFDIFTGSLHPITIDYKLKAERINVELELDVQEISMGETIELHVVFENKEYIRGDSSYTQGELPSVYSTAKKNSVLPKQDAALAAKKMAAGSKLPNWISYKFKLGHIDELIQYFLSMSKKLKGAFEVNVQNVLLASIETTLNTIALIEDIIIQVRQMIHILEELTKLSLGGYFTGFRVDAGVRGIKAVIEDHFTQLDTRLAADKVSWEGQTTAGMILLFKSDALESFLVIKRLMNLIFGDDSAKKEDTPGEVTSSMFPEEVVEVDSASVPTQQHNLLGIDMQVTTCGGSPEAF